MISVIIPYNQDRGYLINAIQSLKGQVDHELILAKGDKSLAANFNDGLNKAKGEYVKILAEDDLLPENALKYLLEGIQGKDFVCANAKNFGRVNEVYKSHSFKLEDLIKKNTIHGGTYLYRTEILRQIGGMDERLTCAEEYEMTLKLLSVGYDLGYVDKVVYKYRIHDDQKSSYGAISRERREMRKKEIEKIQKRYV